jgi:hypothetical protein
VILEPRVARQHNVAHGSDTLQNSEALASRFGGIVRATWYPAPSVLRVFLWRRVPGRSDDAAELLVTIVFFVDSSGWSG